MKSKLAKINLKKKHLVLIIALLFAIPLFIISKYLTTINDDVTINVREPNYTVIFHSNDGEGDTTSQSFVYGTSQNLTANSFSYAGYLFSHWNTMPNGTGESYDDEQTVNNLSSEDADVVDLYAQWDSDFTITGNPDSWTNQNVTLAVVLTSGNYNDYEYSFDNGNTWTNN